METEVEADLHTHLGPGGKNPGFDESMDLFHEKLGDGGIVVIANFADDSGHGRFEEFVEQGGGKYERVPIGDKRAYYVPPPIGMLIIKGQEIQAKDGHLLAIAMPYREVIKTTETRGAMQAAKDLGSLFGPVHPFYNYGMGPYLFKHLYLLSEFAFLEGGNGSAELHIPIITKRNANPLAHDFYHDKILSNPKLDIGIIYASDAHSVEAVGTSWTKLPGYNPSFDDIPLLAYLDPAIRSVKSLEFGNVYMEPNIDDALEHMIKATLGKVRNKISKIIKG